MNSTGSALVYSSYFGGSRYDEGDGIALDLAGNAYVSGSTHSFDFPITPGAFQTTLRGDENAFVSKLNSSGSALVYSTYLGGSIDDEAVGVTLDSSGDAYITGGTFSSDFPTTPGAFQISFSGGYTDVFVSKLNSSGSALVYSTYLGGSGPDYGFRIALDASGNAYITGNTESGDFPTTPGAFQTTFGGDSDAFLSKLNSSGSALVYSTYLGGGNYDYGFGIALDSIGNAYVVGDTLSSDFPTTPGAFQTTLRGLSNAFISKLGFSSSVFFSSFTAKLEVTISTGSFDLNSAFKLGATSNGINPVTEDVILQIGPYSVTIPSGSFTKNKKRAYVFEGTINGVSLRVRVNPRGRSKYTFQAEGSGANLNGIVNPVTVTLTIGNDTGTTHVNAEIRDCPSPSR
jgi:Beta-propeller repeat